MDPKKDKSIGTKIIYAFAIIPTVLLIYILVTEMKGWPENVDIEPYTCQPYGPLATLHEARDPLDFWVLQNIRLENVLYGDTTTESDHIGYDFGRLQKNCEKYFSKNETKLIECKLFNKNRHESLLKCFNQTKILCRLHGGNCG